jgi:lysophospholipase L1-like esterase
VIGRLGPAAEAKRETVNNWIRSTHAFDGVIDFAKATQDRFDRQYLNPAYNRGDSLHPNDAGYQAMANAINLARRPISSAERVCDLGSRFGQRRDHMCLSPS